MPTSPSGRIRIAVTLGDAAGVGPEVALKAIHAERHRLNARILLVGPASFYQALSERLGFRMRFKNIVSLAEWKVPTPFFPCYFFRPLPKKIVRGKPDRRLAALAVEPIRLAAGLALEKNVDAGGTP